MNTSGSFYGQILWHTETSTSDAGSGLYKRMNEALSDNTSISFGDRYRYIINELLDLFNETSRENWDGYGSLAINEETLPVAEKFLRNYPRSLPLPEVGLDPDGEINFEWCTDKDKILSFSFSAENMITYAGKIGVNRISGVEVFIDEIPEILIQQIRRISKS